MHRNGSHLRRRSRAIWRTARTAASTASISAVSRSTRPSLGPLRHPSAPGLIIPDHALGLPVLRALSLCTCRRHYPGAADGRTRRSKSPTRVSLPRFHYRVGLHIVLFEICSAFTHVAACTLAQSPYFVTAIRGLQTFRHLHACPGCFRRERSPGGSCTHWNSAALSRRTWDSDVSTSPSIKSVRRLAE